MVKVVYKWSIRCPHKDQTQVQAQIPVRMSRTRDVERVRSRKKIQHKLLGPTRRSRVLEWANARKVPQHNRLVKLPQIRDPSASCKRGVDPFEVCRAFCCFQRRSGRCAGLLMFIFSALHIHHLLLPISGVWLLELSHECLYGRFMVRSDIYAHVRIVLRTASGWDDVLYVLIPLAYAGFSIY